MRAHPTDPTAVIQRHLTRRALLGGGASGLGAMALNHLLWREGGVASGAPAAGAPGPGVNRPRGRGDLPHFPAKAKRVIYLFQSGGPSHIDLFNYRPAMKALHGVELPDSVRQGQRLTGMTAGQKNFPVCAPLKPFHRRGQSGQWFSEFVPHTGSVADEISVVHSMHTEAINHDPGITYINTGSQIPGRPSLGAWVSYGLGSLNDDFPAYIVLISQGTGKNPGQPIFSRLWGSGFLPSNHQGVKFRAGENPVLYLANPPGVDRDQRRGQLDDLAALNALRAEATGDPEIETRIGQYEMAFRMQASAPDLVDLSDEPESTFELYGPDSRRPGTYAYNCLLARRLAERDVRFIQLFHRGWDQHGSLARDLAAQCRDTDQPSAALVADLKQRGLLEDTVVVWGGEFGRTAYSQGDLGNGRDHHGRCFSLWLAGGGVRGGYAHGETDDYCYNVTRDPVHIRDLNATLLHCLGVDHRRFTFKYQGLHHRITGVEEAHPVRALLA